MSEQREAQFFGRSNADIVRVKRDNGLWVVSIDCRCGIEAGHFIVKDRVILLIRVAGNSGGYVLERKA